MKWVTEIPSQVNRSFAWLPVKLDNGYTVWLTWYWWFSPLSFRYRLYDKDPITYRYSSFYEALGHENAFRRTQKSIAENPPSGGSSVCPATTVK